MERDKSVKTIQENGKVGKNLVSILEN